MGKKSVRKALTHIDFYFVAAALIACAAAFPLLSGGGLLNTRGGGDSPFLLQRLHQLMAALAAGQFPVRWMPDANYGYGYPFFNYYAPLAFYAAAAFKFLGFSYIRAIQLSQLTAFMVAAVAMYRLAKRWFGSQPAALLTSAAYTLAPFHLVNVYIRGDSIAEFWAMAMYPLVILAVHEIIDLRLTIDDLRLGSRSTKYEVRSTILLGLAFAGLIVSHNISAMIFSPFVVLYAAGRWWSIGAKRPPPAGVVGRVAAGLVLGLLLSAWFWLPAIGEQGLTRLNEVTVGYFDYGYADGFHFRGWDLVQGSLIFDPDVADGRAFRMGLAQMILTLAGGFILLWWPGPLKRVRWVWLALFGLATLMITPLSRPLWDTLPLLPFTQFPWRFLSVQAFWGAPLIGALTLAAGRFKFGRAAAAVGASLVLLAAGLAGLKLDFLPLTDAEITAERLAQYEWFTGNIGSTVGAEYLSTEVNPRPFTSRWIQTGQPAEAAVTTGAARLTRIEGSEFEQLWSYDAAAGGAQVVLPTMMWPGWRAWIDGREIPLEAAAGSGLISAELPAGAGELHVRLSRTPIRLGGELVSLIALFAIVAGGVWVRPRFGRQIIVHAALVIGLAGAVIITAWWAAPERPAIGPQTWDFGQFGILHRQTEIRYGNGAVLAAAQLPSEIIAGDKMVITLDWAAVPPGDRRQVTVALTTPAAHFFNFVPELASETRPLTAGPIEYRLPLPDDAPPGLYVPQISFSDNSRPRTLSGEVRGDLMLAPVRITGTAVPVEAEPVDLLDARVTAAEQRPEQRVLDLALEWTTAAPLANALMASYRLFDHRGVPFHPAQFDIQPGYGQRPTPTWPAGIWIADRVALDLRDVPSNRPGEPYTLMVVLYEADSGRTRLTRRLGHLDVGEEAITLRPHVPVLELPGGVTPIEATFVDPAGEPVIVLRGYTREENDGEARIILFWEALAPMAADYTHFVHLLDQVTGELLAQHDAQPQNNTLPTSQWVEGEIVADPAVLRAESVDGPIRVGLYLRNGDTITNLQLENREEWLELK